jgi:hypothetical protein
MKSISVDFDNTLVLWGMATSGSVIVPTGDWEFNLPLINELKFQKAAGHELHILTFRGKNCHSAWDVNEDQCVSPFLLELERLHGLSFDGVTYTDGKCKTGYVEPLEAQIHYDDDEEVCCRMAILTKCLPIYMKNKYSRPHSTLEDLIRREKVLVFNS